ncbi:MAG: FHA domain-containing serine/threonine-protein kinase [Planctomycetaceae bacterium]
MQAPAVSSEFLELLEKSGLYTAAQVVRIGEKLDVDATAPARDMARRLVKERVLTPFQAERILEGRYRGLVIDRYRIREMLGFGGMGCVFIAEDPQEKRKVAIKVMSAEHSLDAGMLTRLKLEARAGMLLQHPNIIKTFRLDSTGAVWYLVMDLIRGISLHELVALKGPLPWAAACDVGVQIASALQEAHDHGIIHRDIKPANFLIEQNGTAHLLDFGLALMDNVQDDEFSLSMLFGHDCLGTPDYIAPEQIVDSRKVDPRADIYSLGATLFVAMTARVPFPDKSNKAKLEAHKTRKVRTVCELRPDIPPAVGAIIARMMEKDPSRRFQSAQEVADALRQHAKRQDISFDFREIVTLRAKQARTRAENTPRKSRVNQRSSITNASGWLRSHTEQLSAAADTFARSETPAVGQAGSDLGMTGRRVPGQSQSTSASRVHQAAPSGWRIQFIGQKSRLPVMRARTSIGRGHDADIVVQDGDLDEIQCWLEFDGSNWQLKQQSRAYPTYLNGRIASYGPVRHGDVLTFGTRKQGFRLINIQQLEKIRQRTQLITVLTIVAAAIAVVAWWWTNR